MFGREGFARHRVRETEGKRFKLTKNDSFERFYEMQSPHQDLRNRLFGSEGLRSSPFERQHKKNL